MQNDFSSLDKLMEFGLGISVATQMMNTMNKALAQTAVPGVGINPGITAQNSPVITKQKSYYILSGENTAGPFNEGELTTLVMKGIVNNETLAWEISMPTWSKAEAIPEVNKILILNQ